MASADPLPTLFGRAFRSAFTPLLILALTGCTQQAREGLQQTKPDGPDNSPVITFQTTGGKVTSFSIEIVSTPQARELGLMYRKELPPDRGMLFVFEDESEHAFWMKNTLIPLDMIFIRSDGRVSGIVHEAEPQTLNARTVGRPSRFVLEINGGLAKKLGIVEGQRARITPEGYW